MKNWKGKYIFTQYRFKRSVDQWLSAGVLADVGLCIYVYSETYSIHYTIQSAQQFLVIIKSYTYIVANYGIGTKGRMPKGRIPKGRMDKKPNPFSVILEVKLP